MNSANGNPLLQRLYSSPSNAPGQVVGVPNILSQQSRKQEPSSITAGKSTATGPHATLLVYNAPTFSAAEKKNLLQTTTHKTASQSMVVRTVDKLETTVPENDEPPVRSEESSIVARFRNTTANTPKEFTYLSMRPRGPRDLYNPYDLQLMNHKDINPSHYFTVSASGVTKFDDGEAEFMELKSWEREHKIFHKLIQFSVFKNYKTWKGFGVWRQLTRRTTVILYRNFLSDNLFHLHPNLSGTLRDVRRICLEFLRGHNLYAAAAETRTLDQFCSSLSSHLSVQKSELEATIKRIRDEIERSCKAAMQTAAIAREREMQSGMDMIDDGRKKRKTIEPRDAANAHKPSYIELSQKRAVCRRLTAFIRLCDYIVINSLTALAMKALRDLHGDLQYPRPNRPKIEDSKGTKDAKDQRKADDRKDKKTTKKEEKERTYFEGMVFNCDILYSTEGDLIQIKPSSTSFAQKVDELVKEYIKTVSTIPRFAQMEVFRVYTEHAISDNADSEAGMGPDVGEMVAAEDEYKSLTLGLRSSLAGSFGAVEKYAREFEPFRMMHMRNERLDPQAIKRQNESLEFFRDSLAKYKQQSEDIEKKIPNSKNVALFCVHTEALRDFFTPSPVTCLRHFHELLPDIFKEKNAIMLENMRAWNQKLEVRPVTVEEYFAYMNEFSELEKDIDDINRDFDFLRELFALMLEEKMQVFADDDETYRSATRPQYEKLRNHMQRIEDERESQQRYFAKKIDENFDELRVRIAEMAVRAKDPVFEQEVEEIDSLNNVMARVAELQSESDAIQRRSAELATFQKSFGLEETEIDTLPDIAQAVKDNTLLWNTVLSWNELTERFSQTPISTIDVDDLKVCINQHSTTAKTISGKMPNNSAVHKLKVETESWSNVAPVVNALKSNKLQPGHKAKIDANIGPIVDANGTEKMFYELPDVTLAILAAKGIFSSKDAGKFITDVGKQAAEEHKLEDMLLKVQNRWVTGTPGGKPAVEFVLNNHKDLKDLFVLSGTSVEEIIAELEETSIVISTIASSKYCLDFLKEKVERWERNIKTIHETIDKWLEFQRNWIYLENIFASNEIKSQWKEDALLFTNIDNKFRVRMRNVRHSPNVYRTIIDSGSTPLLEIFENDNRTLENIQSSLERKLDEKRRLFPRFYFLSDDELLNILANTKNPKMIMTHMLKMFDGIKTLELNGSNDITHMLSEEGERVELSQKNIKAGRGQVEGWLVALEKEMYATLRKLAKDCVVDHEKRSRTSWIFEHPVQLVLIVSQMFWSRSIEKALGKDNSRDLMEKVRDQNYQQLNDLAGLTGLNLCRVHREVLSTLITLDVHGRDLVDEMYENGVVNPAEFGWTKQLRVYWEPDEEDGVDTIVLRQNNSRFVYGYEYLGAQGRLVITPLTDRIYMTITGALKLYLGAAPAGPAGTGKTETVKDMAKNLARRCIVYNCSDGVNYKTMEKFFSGLIQTGAWTCLDEFNRINIEVLSVIASQVLEIKLALQNRQSKFTFQGTPDVVVRSTYGAFITMNPGYAGRTELPDNLKILFRPVAVMTPDFRMIAEVILYSQGFRESKDLSLKITQLYKLSSEQLSPQDHYDFGMRALKSILVMAGDLKRSQPDVSENLTLIVACNDSNIPKFVAEDIPLFRGIMQDLFPGITFPEREYGELFLRMYRDMEAKSLENVDSWVKKGIQFYETLIVRHGVMLVGVTNTGKSEILNCIANALTFMAEDGVDNKVAKPVHQSVINPKSILMHELYGVLDPMTSEWRDGVLASIAKENVRASEESKDHRWIVFDGPVDTLWIESLNSVLDDSKLLCLDSGERIKLPETMHLIFEVADLAVASPATVSRCGMVYLDANDLPWEAIVGKWARVSLSKYVQPQCAGYILSVVNHMVPLGMDWLTKQTVLINGGVMNAVQSCLDLYSAMLATVPDQKIFADVHGDTVLAPDDPLFRERNELCNMIFAFSFVWSFGGNVDSAAQEQFDTFARESMETLLALPKTDTLYDFVVDTKIRQFVSWKSRTPDFKYDPKVPFFDIQVPTVDTVRYTFLLETLLRVDKPVLFSGQTGVGKSIIVNGCLNKNKDEMGLALILFQFSAQTSSARTQELIESKMKHKRKNILCAPPDRKVVLFIDDLNMPALEVYGASPPIELLRQLMGNGGFYDRKVAGFWKHVTEVTVCAACGPPEGGRNPVTMRLTRMFHLLQIPTLSEESMIRIFESILTGFFTQPEKNFSKEVQSLARSMIIGSVDLFQKIRAELRPRPATPHYTYNLRDLAKVCQGLMQVAPRGCKTASVATRLWIHENMRCFYDRLANDDDRRLFTEDLVMDVIKQRFPGSHTHEEYFEREPLIWGDFFRPGGPTADAVYEESAGIKAVSRKFDECLHEYNAVVSSSAGEGLRSSSMNLVFFTDHCKHLARIIRIIRQPRGNALLVGVGGSGKRSLTRLAAHIAGFKRFEIAVGKNYSMNDFHENLLELYRIAGVKCQPLVFILSDDQIVNETMLEDINNILNSGEVPSLFPPDERDKMINSSTEAANSLGIFARDEIYNYFISRSRDNMHIVLCMSPVGDSFRTRCRQFPSLTNCCSIDWYDEWPAEALHGVAQRLLGELPIAAADPDLKQKLIGLCVDVHQCADEASKKFWNQLRRRYYLTPTSYLDFINLFIGMLDEKTANERENLARFVSGRQKMISTDATIAVMKKQIETMQPQLEAASKNAAIVSVEVKDEMEKAEVVERDVSKQESEASVQQKSASEIASVANAALAEAEPEIKKAEDALNAIEQSHIFELSQTKVPGRGAMLAVNAVMTFFEPKDVPGWNGSFDWKGCREFLTSKGLLKQIKEYDVDNIRPKVLQRIRDEFISKGDDFKPESVLKTGSKMCSYLCMWVHAVNTYSLVMEKAVPLRTKSAEANAALEEVNGRLKDARTKLKEVQDRLKTLQTNAEAVRQQKEKLEMTVKQCRSRLRNAEQLSESLKNEGVRWEESIRAIEEGMKSLPLRVFFSSACMAYFAAFTPKFRTDLVTKWVSKAQEKGVDIQRFSFVESMGDPMDTLTWQIASLPTDDTSTENAIIVSNSRPPRRWPLLIDPQGQGVKWLTQMHKKDNFIVVRLTDKTYVHQIEQAIQYGRVVLLADVGESLDPALEPLLSRQIFTEDGDSKIQMSRSITYNDSFRLYISTKMANPHYLPDVSTKVTLVNFTVTMDGLENQMLGEVVSIEKRSLEEESNATIKSISDGQKNLKEMEEGILRRLNTVQGDALLDDEDLISTLQQTQRDAATIAQNQKAAVIKMNDIRQVRELYRSVARRSALLYFVLADLALIDPMYQYSLDYFKKLVQGVVTDTAKPEGFDNDTPQPDLLEEHLLNLVDGITETTYLQICRGLFNKDKTILSLLMCTSIARDREEISYAEWEMFIRASALVSNEVEPIPASISGWINPQQWELIDVANRLVPSLKGLKDDVIARGEEWRTFATGSSPHESPLPGKATGVDWEGALTAFQRILVLRCFREEKLLFALSNYVSDQMGRKFIEPPPFSIERAFADSSPSVPIVFILSPGSDPMNTLQSFANQLKKNLVYVSLGQGQGENAKRIIESSKKAGHWAMLQNCHLSKTFMAELERQVAALQGNPTVHADFRLWITSTPAPFFPVYVLQNSIKLTNEAPTGLKANMIRCFNEIHVDEYEIFKPDEMFPECSKEHAYKKLLYGLCFFHSVVLERKKFGPLGWNAKYEWNDTDFHVSKQWIRLFFEEQATIPWDSLEYITGQINYGGRVTDPQDRGTLMTILGIYMNKQVLIDGYSFSESGNYRAPPVGTLQDVQDFLSEMSLIDGPEVFGMHENADLRFQLQESQLLMNTVLMMQPRLVSSAAGGPSPQEQVMQKCKDFESQVPGLISKEEAGPRSFTVLPNGLPNSLSTVLSHELVKYNKLLSRIQWSLTELQRALKGLTVLSEDLDKMYQSFLNDKVPHLWADVSYASLKPLGSWFRDLCARVHFIRSWVQKGEPTCFWLPGFFNPSAFMTGMLQAFARAEGISVDKLGFSFVIVDQEEGSITEQPHRGCYLSGLFSDSWRWDSSRGVMADSLPGEPFSSLPVIHFLPEPFHKTPDNFHKIPLYRTAQRAGVISSLGASSNYILSIEAKTDKGREYWALKGAACVCSLSV